MIQLKSRIIVFKLSLCLNIKAQNWNELLNNFNILCASFFLKNNVNFDDIDINNLRLQKGLYMQTDFLDGCRKSKNF